MSTLAGNLTTSLDAASGSIYCAGTVSLGGDDSGFVPTDSNTAKCEDQAAKNLAKFGNCITTCHTKQADAALAARSFDEEACEQGLGTPASCRATYDKATAALLVKNPAICPACLTATVMGTLADQLLTQLDGNQQSLYCAGATPLPLP